MGFFETISEKAGDAYRITADKTSKMAKQTKLRMDIGRCKEEIEKVYTELGKIVYKDYILIPESIIKEQSKEECKKIDELSTKMEALKVEIEKLN